MLGTTDTRGPLRSLVNETLILNLQRNVRQAENCFPELYRIYAFPNLRLAHAPVTLVNLQAKVSKRYTGSGKRLPTPIGTRDTKIYMGTGVTRFQNCGYFITLLVVLSIFEIFDIIN